MYHRRVHSRSWRMIIPGSVVALVDVEDILDKVIVLGSNLDTMVLPPKRMRAAKLMYVRDKMKMISTRYSIRRIRLKTDLARMI